MGVLAANAATGALTIFGITGGAAVALGWGAVRVADGDLELRALMIVLMLGVEVFRPLRELVQLYHDGVMAMSSAEGIFAIMDSPAAVSDPDGERETHLTAGAVGDLNPEITFEDVSHAYSEGRRPALHDLSFALHEGETLGLVGPSGAGKSTIVWLMLRFFDPQQGVIRLGGRDLRDIPLHQLRERISVVTQDTYLFHGTVAENLRFGNPNATQAQLEEAARAANAHEFISQLPRGYDTVVGERAVRLSGGQKQRIAIARALLKDAPILILDEALSSVDAENEALIQQALDGLMEGRTTLIIAHRLSSVVNADRILVLEEGRLVETGNHGELVAAGGLYANLMSQQQERIDFVLQPPEETHSVGHQVSPAVDVSAFIPQTAHGGHGHHHHAAPQANRDDQQGNERHQTTRVRATAMGCITRRRRRIVMTNRAMNAVRTATTTRVRATAGGSITRHRGRIVMTNRAMNAVRTATTTRVRATAMGSITRHRRRIVMTNRAMNAVRTATTTRVRPMSTVAITGRHNPTAGITAMGIRPSR
jgi:ABC-type multidrug transport system ATPase subunit